MMSEKSKLLQIAVVTLLLNMSGSKVFNYIDGLSCSLPPMVIKSVLSEAKHSQCQVHRTRKTSARPTVIWSLGEYLKVSWHR